jgi:hypothetical protein
MLQLDAIPGEDWPQTGQPSILQNILQSSLKRAL